MRRQFWNWLCLVRDGWWVLIHRESLSAGFRGWFAQSKITLNQGDPPWDLD